MAAKFMCKRKPLNNYINPFHSYSLNINNPNTLHAPQINKASHYFHRAKRIDRLRLLLHYKPWTPSLPKALERIELDTFVVSQALRTSKLLPLTALSFTEWLKSKPELYNNHYTHHSIIKVLSDAGKVEQMQSMVEEIKSGKYKKVSVSFMDLLHWNARAKNFEGVENIWIEMKKKMNEEEEKEEPLKPNAEFYNIYIDMIAERGRYSEVGSLFLEMIEAGVLPNARTYTVLIKHLLKLGKLNEAFEVFKRLPTLRVKHTAKQYTLLVEEFARMNDVESMRLLVREMQNDGVLPSRALISAVRILKDAGLEEEAEEIVSYLLPDANIEALGISQMFDLDSDDNDNGDVDGYGEDDSGDNSGEPSQNLKPWLNPNALASALSDWNDATIISLEKANLVWNTRLVCKVLRAFKKIDVALEFFHWVAYQPGFAHDIYTISRMAVMLARKGKAEAVDRLLLKARSEELKLSVSTMRLIIEAYGISMYPDAALRIFKEIKLFGLKPNRLLYSSLIHTLVKCNQGLKAKDILEEMILANICPDIQIFTVLMQDFGRAGDLKTVQLLFQWINQSGGKPDAHCYRILIHAYCENERAALTFRLFEDMKSTNMRLDAETKTLLVNSLWTQGKLREAADVEDEYEKEGLNLPKALPGSIWKASGGDLMLIYDIVSRSFL
ncbi:pentatricopeptide repeat-containing protein At5g66631 isoform X1 [Cryptomeria japonica]|uniref:pentatricopeptide repeat-containing protein At5g66631 isoform X1 n=1 Tax=Cryptomeria japonica TaxID=3369 RepID=UPI0027DA516F|nr:pentatricopeptide repeat-containing protein At5g66631 isoform X1 [Cryptomeria japonica]